MISKHLLTIFFVMFFVFLGSIGAYILVPHFITSRPQATVAVLPTPTPDPTPTPTPSPTPVLAPATLIIPKLGIQAAVEHVGVTPANNMDVPKNAADVAWFQYGAAPGEEGNAVIAGHYDTPTGKPAIFYFLKTLEVGDEIEVISQGAVRLKFEVTEVASIPYDVFPNEYVFKDKPGRNVNLITCGGVWDPVQKIYSNRIVVYTTLKEGLEAI
ncbi:class F sortase [Candidatus Microgenomates bacterium]|nr:MAG: class F sortase [Candidatus Microgenomates bacterium]